MKPSLAGAAAGLVAATMLALAPAGCTRLGFSSSAATSPDGSPDGDAGGGADVVDALGDDAPASPRLSCTFAGQVGASPEPIREPGITVDGLHLFARDEGASFTAWESTRPDLDAPWSDWAKTSRLASWTQDPSFLAIDGQLELFAARSPQALDMPRAIYRCSRPFESNATTCQKVTIYDVNGDEITDDLDGPSLALLRGSPTMTISWQLQGVFQRVLIATPRAGDLLAWDAVRLQGGEIDTDDVVLSDDASLLVSTTSEIIIWRRHPDGSYRRAQSLSPDNLAEESANELFLRPDGSWEIYYSAFETAAKLPKERRIYLARCVAQ
ncbi:MAG: hypothetical protein KC503_37400 [Myxococcales bacterium]|nr:hypothetical protein [Myxococcales bacterium]